MKIGGEKMDKLLAENIYYEMVLGRAFEYAAKEHYMGGDIAGFLHLDIGQEGFSVSTMKAFEKGDVFTTYREHVMAIARGIEPRAVMAELFGKAAGVSRGRGGSMHLIDPAKGMMGAAPIVAGTISLAVGAALSSKIRKDKRVTVSFFGDGATGEGVLFESLGGRCFFTHFPRFSNFF